MPTLTVSMSESAYLDEARRQPKRSQTVAREDNARSASLEVRNVVEAERDAEDHVALDRPGALGSKHVGSIAELETHLLSHTRR